MDSVDSALSTLRWIGFLLVVATLAIPFVATPGSENFDALAEACGREPE